MAEILAQMVIDGKLTLDVIENSPAYAVFFDKAAEIVGWEAAESKGRDSDND